MALLTISASWPKIVTLGEMQRIVRSSSHVAGTAVKAAPDGLQPPPGAADFSEGVHARSSGAVLCPSGKGV